MFSEPPQYVQDALQSGVATFIAHQLVFVRTRWSDLLELSDWMFVFVGRTVVMNIEENSARVVDVLSGEKEGYGYGDSR